MIDAQRFQSERLLRKSSPPLEFAKLYLRLCKVAVQHLGVCLTVLGAILRWQNQLGGCERRRI